MNPSNLFNNPVPAHPSPTPRRRQPGIQPPSLLTTSLENNARQSHHGVGPAQTPVSTTTTSLSSPFSAYPQSQSAHPTTGTPLSSLASSMHSHQSPSVSAQYNPQQWGPMSGGTSNSAIQHSTRQRLVALAPRMVGPDEPVGSPPPPYSPRREGDPASPARTIHVNTSPSEATSVDESSRNTTPLTSANAMSPDLRIGSGQTPLRQQQQASARSSPVVSANSAFPPPPGSQTPMSRFRSSSKDHAGRLLSSLTSRNRSNTTSPVNAVDVLQYNTAQALERSPVAELGSPANHAPAARRAASTGGISLDRATPPSATAPQPWARGVPLPPPPTRPPPSSARTQSLNRPQEHPTVGQDSSLPLRHRYPPGHGTALETVPPTPANWQQDSDNSTTQIQDTSNQRTLLHLDTGSIIDRHRNKDPVTASASTPFNRRRDSYSAGLARTPALRSKNSMGLRERRSESKHGKDRAPDSRPDDRSGWQDDDAEIRPSNLELDKTHHPRSVRQHASSRTANTASIVPDIGSSRSVRSAPTSASIAPNNLELPHEDPLEDSTPTPPASAKSIDRSTTGVGVPRQRQNRLSQKLSLLIRTGNDQRPLSHLLHTPNPEDSLQLPLAPAGQLKDRPVSDLIGPESPRAFAERANERHRNFAEREAAASSDSERLELFIRFMIAESRIRREQYEQAFKSEDLDMEELAKELFQPIPSQEESLLEAPSDQDLAPSRPVSMSSSAMADLSSPDGASSISRQPDSASSATSVGSIPPPTAGGHKDFVPCLSPIASMSVVTGQDDEARSRGRPPSRWWETPTQSESGANDGFSVLARSKRESKYMGVPKEARDSGTFFGRADSTRPQQFLEQDTQSQQIPPIYGPNEYPPEKVGWHEQDVHAIPPPPRQQPTPESAPLFSPNNTGLDISRFVTLPPPYPRHHPAVNNNHPELAEFRNVVRSLHGNEESKAMRGEYDLEIQTKRKRAGSWREHQSSLHRQDVQYRMENDEITQEIYDQMESGLDERIRQSEKEVAQFDFDIFQNMVVTPLHAVYSDRISIATSNIDQITNALFTATSSRSPNLPLEEGDEQPELLEKLTLLKWLFEGRESLHQRTFDLLSERNDKYKEIVILPYRQTSNQAKIEEATRFFTQDAQDRQKAFDQKAHDRAQAFLNIIENNVARGVEMQLDAFWQIAPDLKKILNQIPRDLADFHIRIPAEEYEENPSYYDHPMQYLSSLLGHTEKATYQFIESQTNLLCLLHEIRCCALNATCRADGHEGRLSGVTAYRQREETRLTADLKEKVGDVEGQWADALGDELRVVRERVREQLLQEGGWDDEAEDI